MSGSAAFSSLAFMPYSSILLRLWGDSEVPEITAKHLSTLEGKLGAYEVILSKQKYLAIELQISAMFNKGQSVALLFSH